MSTAVDLFYINYLPFYVVVNFLSIVKMHFGRRNKIYCALFRSIILAFRWPNNINLANQTEEITEVLRSDVILTFDS